MFCLSGESDAGSTLVWLVSLGRVAERALQPLCDVTSSAPSCLQAVSSRWLPSASSPRTPGGLGWGLGGCGISCCRGLGRCHGNKDTQELPLLPDSPAQRFRRRSGSRTLRLCGPRPLFLPTPFCFPLSSTCTTALIHQHDPPPPLFSLCPHSVRSRKVRTSAALLLLLTAGCRTTV